MYTLNVNNRGYALVVSTTFMLFLSLTAYLVITHGWGVKDAGKYLKNSETTQTMLSLRNVLVEDAIAIGSLRNADPNDSLPSYLVGLNYNPPVNDVWGSEIKYCVYGDFNQPARGLAGRLLSAGENRKLQTLCSDETAKGDDIAINIFADAFEGTIISPEHVWSPPVMISANFASSYLVREDGTVWAWGYNRYSYLQEGTIINRRLPVQPRWSANENDFMSDVREVSSGTTYGFLMLKKDSTVWAASLNKYPMYIMNDATKVQSAGPGLGAAADEPVHGMALKSDGTVWSWGYYAPSRILLKARLLSSAISVSVSKTAANIVSDYALGLKSDGTVWSWGENTYGQLGDGTLTNSITYQVQVTGLSDVIATSAGNFHSLALKSDGTVWAWGRDNMGQLGDDSVSMDKKMPVQTFGLSGVIAISAGIYHSMALKSDGTVWAWGSNSNSRLGDGTTILRRTPVQVKGAGGVGFLTDVIAISAGANHSMALKSDGTVWAWGRNSTNKELGDETSVNRATPVQVTRLTGATVIAAGGGNSFAIGPDNAVWAWGKGWPSAFIPARIWGPGGEGTLNGITQISTNFYTSTSYHSLALKSDGTVWAWGDNNNGQLGDGTATDSNTPVQVLGLSDVIAIAAGGRFSMALKSDGTVWTWGNNGGRLGDGTTVQRYTPVQVVGEGGIGYLAAVITISAGTNHSLALKSDGTVLGWGMNNTYQLGDGTNRLRNTPVYVSGLTNIKAIVAGGSHSMAIRSDGTVWAWGLNSSGQLGNGSWINKTKPANVLYVRYVVP